MIVFIIFYGLDWVATVPPTVALCREHFGADGAIVFGWVLASHQVGAGLVAFLGRTGPRPLRRLRRRLLRRRRAVRDRGGDGPRDREVTATLRTHPR